MCTVLNKERPRNNPGPFSLVENPVIKNLFFLSQGFIIPHDLTRGKGFTKARVLFVDLHNFFGLCLVWLHNPDFEGITDFHHLRFKITVKLTVNIVAAVLALTARYDDCKRVFVHDFNDFKK